MELDERKVNITYEGSEEINWFLDLTASNKVALPFKKVNTNNIDCEFEEKKYSIEAEKVLFQYQTIRPFLEFRQRRIPLY